MLTLITQYLLINEKPMHTKQYYLFTEMHAYLRTCKDSGEGHRMGLGVQGKNKTRKGPCMY